MNFNLNDYSLWTALVTPFNDDLTVDYPSFKNLINEQVEAQNGLLILGSTGEALNLSTDVKKQIVKFVCELKPNAPIMIGVGGHELEATLDWIKFNETMPIHSYLFVTPLYSKPGDEGQYHWFKTLMDNVTKPVMLYNVPGRTGKELSVSAVSRLKDHKNYWAIKEASGSVEKFKGYLKASGNKPVFCGDDGLLPEFVAAGSCGLISVASNVWPKETHLYVKKCVNKSFDHRELWNKASNSLFIASNPVPAKRALYELKRISTKKMMPPLHEDDLKEWNEIEKYNTLVTEWFNELK